MEMFKAGNKLSQTSFSDLFIRKENRYNLGRNREFQIPKKKTSIVWKVSKCGVISGPYFPVFSPNTGKYGPEKTPYLVTFHSVNFYSVRYSVNSVRYFGPIIKDLISHKLSIICKLIGKLKNGIHKCKPRKCPCRICKTFFSKHRFLQYI